MSTITPNTFAPYSTRAELAKGKRKALLSLAVAMTAVILAIVASRTVDDDRLVAVYALAGGMHFVVCLVASIRWSRTPTFARDDRAA
jgi:hypothetical protein